MPSCMRFLQIVPPKIDTEIMEKTTDHSYPESFEARTELYSSLKLLAVGGTRGSIMFLSIEDMGNLYARVSYHREKIINLQEVANRETRQEWLVSICEEKYLKILTFSRGKANCTRTVFMGELYVGMRGF